MTKTRNKSQSAKPVNSHRSDTPLPEHRLIFLTSVLAILFLGVLAYINSFHGVLVLDDIKHIQVDDTLHDIWPGWPDVITRRRSFTTFTLALNYHLHGQSTRGYHLVNLIIHLSAGLLLFGILRRTLKLPALREQFFGSWNWLALIVALIWVLHPLQTQSVTYIIQRAESLMGLFYFLTLYCVLRGVHSLRPVAWYAAAIFACGLGMGSKPIMVTTPVVILLFDRIFLASSIAELLRRRWWMYLGFACTWGVILSTRLVPVLLGLRIKPTATVGFQVDEVTWWDYLSTQPGVILHYVKLCFWPYPQSLDYNWPVAQTTIQIIVPGVIILLLLGLTIWMLLKRPCIAFLGIWFFVILSPTSSIIPIKDMAFEHRMYLPLAAVVAGVVFGVYWILNRIASRNEWSRFTVPRILIGLAGVVVVALMIRTSARNSVYASDIDIWQDVVKHRPNHPRAFNLLGFALGKAQRNEEALEAFQTVLHLVQQTDQRYYQDAKSNEGYTLFKLGRYEESLVALREAIELNPENESLRFRLGNTLEQLGQLDAAADAYREAIIIKPDFDRAWFNLGRMLLQLNHFDEAVDAIQSAIESNPKDDDLLQYYLQLGNVLLGSLGRVKDAEVAYRAGLNLNPRHPDLLTNLSNTLLNQNRPADALEAVRNAILIQPQHSTAHYIAGQCLEMLNQIEAAQQEYQFMLQIDPNNQLAREALNLLDQKTFGR